ncbi:MAG TPA: hypothetical protein VFW11_23390 [Cyclobacteriaceae bacterium]|nr:hypothetical protein [Cyclobacteriaceae bacterium]
MTTKERQRIENELRKFAAQNFERPSNCRNLEQIRYYVRELSVKIEEMRNKFNYVPSSAYSLLAQYNAKQNSIIGTDFRKTYCS